MSEHSFQTPYKEFRNFNFEAFGLKVMNVMKAHIKDKEFQECHLGRVWTQGDEANDYWCMGFNNYLYQRSCAVFNIFN